MDSDLPSSFINYQPEGPSDAALKNLIFNEPRTAVSKLRDLDETNSKSERFEFLYLLIDILSPDRSDELPLMCWNSLLDAGLPQLLIEIFSKELKNTERGKTHIHLACALSAASQCLKTAAVRNCQMCLSIFVDQADSIVEVIWPYRQYLTADATTWTEIGRLVSALGTVFAMSRPDDIPRIFNAEKPLSALVFNAWLFADPNELIEQSISLLLQKASLADLTRFVQKFVIEDEKVSALRLKLRDALNTAIDEPLERVFGIATKLAVPGNLTLTLEMISERADVKLIVACNRQLDHGHRKFDRNIFHYAVHWIYDLLYRLDPERDPRMAAIIENNVFRFLARVSIVSAKRNEHQDFVDSLKKILETHIRHGEVFYDFIMAQHDLSLYEDVCSRFLQYLTHVVRNLRALPKTRTTTTLLTAWLNIAAALDVEEPQGGRDIDSSVCSWKECHGLDRLEKMNQCSRCKLARYCGSNCQRRDWIEGGHKGQCSKRRV